MSERDDYADNDLPPARRWPTDLLVEFGLVVALLGIIAVMALWSIPRPVRRALIPATRV